MIKYFISYKNLMSDNKILKELDLYSQELKIVKRNKNGNYRIEPILYFRGYAEDVLMFSEQINSNNKGISLMVELTKDEVKKLNPLYINKLETEDGKNFTLCDKKTELKLINYNCLTNMSSSEINSSEFQKIVVVENKVGKNTKKNNYFKR